MIIFEVLNCKSDWEVIPNKIGNKKIHLSVNFFKNKYPDNIIECINSKVTDNRIIIKIKK